MNIYFAGSIRGVSPDKSLFLRLINHCTNHGHVLTEHSFDYRYEDEIKVDDEWIYQTDMGWLRKANAVVAEVTWPSLGVGYEIAKAEEWGKPLLLLHREGSDRRLSAMLSGNKGLMIKSYGDPEEACSAIDEFIASLKTG